MAAITNIKCVCPMCGVENFVVVDGEDFDKWQAGTLIQDAFPHLSADEREQLLTGICTPCWDKM
jgi:hypothetical protein